MSRSNKNDSAIDPDVDSYFQDALASIKARSLWKKIKPVTNTKKVKKLMRASRQTPSLSNYFAEPQDNVSADGDPGDRKPAAIPGKNNNACNKANSKTNKKSTKKTTKKKTTTTTVIKKRKATASDTRKVKKLMRASRQTPSLSNYFGEPQDNGSEDGDPLDRKPAAIKTASSSYGDNDYDDEGVDDSDSEDDLLLLSTSSPNDASTATTSGHNPTTVSFPSAATTAASVSTEGPSLPSTARPTVDVRKKRTYNIKKGYDSTPIVEYPKVAENEMIRIINVLRRDSTFTDSVPHLFDPTPSSTAGSNSEHPNYLSNASWSRDSQICLPRQTRNSDERKRIIPYNETNLIYISEWSEELKQAIRYWVDQAIDNCGGSLIKPGSTFYRLSGDRPWNQTTYPEVLWHNAKARVLPLWLSSASLTGKVEGFAIEWAKKRGRGVNKRNENETSCTQNYTPTDGSVVYLAIARTQLHEDYEAGYDLVKAERAERANEEIIPLWGYQKAETYVHALPLPNRDSVRHYKKYVKDHPEECKHLPGNPAKYYKKDDEWKDWYHFLGATTVPTSGKPWTKQEVTILFEQQKIRGSKWVEIGRKLDRPADGCRKKFAKLMKGREIVSGNNGDDEVNGQKRKVQADGSS